MSANAKHRRRSRRTSVGWNQRQQPEIARQPSTRAVDYAFVQVARDAYAVGGYVYRTGGGPWKVGFHRRPRVPEGRLL